ncbi:bifunctional 3-(3-hydroxy-phenyl)propionate/3-hydroxycinnamic acid hydroxylase [Amycolatopsis rhabdoformis]|uniref:Bifunctional 3-(3-hydroxy-phenyl)propionate/3-hydroxycinnamic acid hydroxylase n=1 Tax=Amycolatopsis rhabdoformis TaxID=1448059 RepID=A0ABZ1IIQ6_9PSEU|nr:bifunctional 3-(3-hydroxy-phenyl)propionate/3-hydroxycinnamic acid hydroxylase [Amycolatopsis rhabdoformis]WSE34132.1 bifunctional 3-(3-hydroxy-phenyl)propionate/3-hydroxycinnamic acid hydroxylase [Amycolatopsis rhabdoformis]
MPFSSADASTHPEGRPTPDDGYDVVIVGAGPVGLTAAGLLGRLGHRVAVVERHPGLYNLPRAGHIDHEIMRTFQLLGFADALLADAVACDTYTLRNGKGELLTEFPWAADGVSGWKSDYMLYQPELEDLLYSHDVDDPAITFHRGFEVHDFLVHEDHVEVHATAPAAPADLHGPAREARDLVLRGRFLLGADGGRSFVRDRLGIRRADLGFSSLWANADARRNRDRVDLPFDSGQWCDPNRPTTVLPLGKRHRRFEWALLPGETAEEMADPAVAWELLAGLGLTSEDLSIVRYHVWRFEAKIAEQWQRGRVFLLGDAAHTMPPFQGQGMCSGIRDASNLVWKLDLVLRGITAEALLDTYQQEREPNLRAWTELSIETGRLPCTLDPDEAERRDEAFRSGAAKHLPVVPPLSGVVRDGSGAGELSLQARVSRAGAPGLFDDVIGGGFTVVSTAGDPAAVLAPRQRAFLDALRAQVVHVAPDGAGGVTDVDGAYAAHFAERGWDVVVTRPDFYVFGAGSLSELPAIVDDLAARLGADETR